MQKSIHKLTKLFFVFCLLFVIRISLGSILLLTLHLLYQYLLLQLSFLLISFLLLKPWLVPLQMKSVVLRLDLIKSLVNYPYKQILLLVLIGTVPKLALKIKGPVSSKETMLKTISLLTMEKVVNGKRLRLTKPREEVQVGLKLVHSCLPFFLFAFLHLFFFFVIFLLLNFL